MPGVSDNDHFPLERPRAFSEVRIFIQFVHVIMQGSGCTAIDTIMQTEAIKTASFMNFNKNACS